MAPFPTRRKPSSSSILPTILSGSSTSPHSYPPLPPSSSTTPAHSPHASRASSFSYPAHAPVSNQAYASHGRLDPDANDKARRVALFGSIDNPNQGSLKGLAGQSWASRDTVRQCLQENHINSHTFFNDKGFHNHCAHHLLAAYSLGASPSLLEEILTLHQETASKPMPPMALIEITEANWTEYLGDERFYPNYLAFFHRLISAPPPATSPYYGRRSSVVPVIEQYLLGGQGQMLIRAVSGAIHPLIHIGHGVEFELDSVVAEGLAQCAVHDPRVAALFPSEWPPAPAKPSQLQSAFSSAFSSLRLSTPTTNYFGSRPIASPSDNFARASARLPREHDDRRYPREGLSGFTILARMLSDDSLAAGNAGSLSDMPKLDGVLRNRSREIVRWCEEWKFSTERSQEWDNVDDATSDEGRKSGSKGKNASHGVPSWDEVVEKTEELFWMATVIYAAATRPGYKAVKLDFFTMHGLTSAIFLPPLLEAISPHLRPYLVTSHFRVLVAYWVSRGRPDLYIEETLLAATAQPLPPNETRPPSDSAVSRSIAENRHEKGSKSSTTSPPLSGPSEPRSPLHEQRGQLEHEDDDVEEPHTPKATTSVSLPSVVVAEDVHRSESLQRERSDEDALVTNPWMKVLQSAVDHHDEHVTKAVRSLYFAATHFGASPPGYFTSSLPGTQIMDGSIFLRAAGMTLSSLGWAHEGDKGIVGTWDRSALGYDETWNEDERVEGGGGPGPYGQPGWKGKMREHSNSQASSSRSSLSSFGQSSGGRGGGRSSTSRSRSGTIMSPQDEEVVHFGAGDSALLSPRLAHVNGFVVASGYPGAAGGARTSSSGSRSPRGTSPRTSTDSLRSASVRMHDAHVGSSASLSSSTSSSAGGVERVGWRKVGEELTQEEKEAEERQRRREEEERELMA
ncbi:hypothetical protein JCM10212_005714 [Sporobolomyces blumeae]